MGEGRRGRGGDRTGGERWRRRGRKETKKGWGWWREEVGGGGSGVGEGGCGVGWNYTLNLSSARIGQYVSKTRGHHIARCAAPTAHLFRLLFRAGVGRHHGRRGTTIHHVAHAVDGAASALALYRRTPSQLLLLHPKRKQPGENTGKKAKHVHKTSNNGVEISA